ncbi:unnamed protein product [Adineta steineri]|uniref:EamA domain-containing protein n=1 Tax=Adineta steineri TaxID=433720 RepID=A0A814I544_9BILA|nr:unnamed protein product [Adineta steineri]CAF3706729.1 unnamed protein product [Adineta steineri]
MMSLKENGLYEDDSDSSDGPIEAIAFFPPAVSTLSINDLSMKKDSGHKNGCYMRFSGVIYSLLASLIFTCATFSIKQIGVDLLGALFLRFIVQLLIMFSFIRYKKYPFLFGTPFEIFLQAICCATGAGGLFIYYIALDYAELSDVTTLFYTKVVWTVVFSIFIYRERPSISILVALPLTITGVVFVTRPSFLFSSSSNSSVNNNHRLIGLSLSIIGAITSSTNILVFKRLVSTSKNIKPSVITFQYCLAVFILLIINQLYRKFILDTGLTINYVISWRYILASVVCLTIIAVNLLVQKAMKRENPSIFTLLGSSDIIFALILQNIFTTKRSDLFTLLGSALVICSVVIIGLSKILNEQPSHQKVQLMDNQNNIKDLDETNDKC